MQPGDTTEQPVTGFHVASAKAILADASKMFSDCGGSFISPEGDGFASEGDMLDTNFHLTARARMKRSELLADALCDVVECKP